jgi:hypothetical protein
MCSDPKSSSARINAQLRPSSCGRESSVAAAGPANFRADGNNDYFLFENVVAIICSMPL